MAWTQTLTAQKIGNIDHLTPPASFASLAEQEQWDAARRAAIALVQSRTLGAAGSFTVALSGTGNPGHPSGDTITVTVTVP